MSSTKVSRFNSSVTLFLMKDSCPYQPLRILASSDRSILITANVDLKHLQRIREHHQIVEDPSQLVQVVLKFTNTSSMTKQETQCLSSCFHPNIIRLLDAFHFDAKTCFVYERATGDCVIDLLVKAQRFSETQSKMIANQLCSCLSYLHSQGWSHGDIKPDNLVFDDVTQSIKLIDFEFCSRVPPTKKHNSLSWLTIGSRKPRGRGTFQYSSPEVRTGKQNGPESDVWSLGVTIFVMLTGHFPFNETELRQGNEIFVCPKVDVSSDCQIMLKTMFVKDCKGRSSAKNVLKSDWLET